jgi:DNA-binding IclR family transcriptional regulator
MQSCHLGAAEGDHLHVLVAGRSPLPMYYAVKVGSVFPLLETSSGVVIAADWDEPALQRLVAGTGEPPPDGLRERLRAVRDLGYEVYDSRIVLGIRNVSAPVRDSTGRVREAMTIPFLAQSRAKPPLETVLPQLVDAARRLSARLGHASDERTTR